MIMKKIICLYLIMISILSAFSQKNKYVSFKISKRVSIDMVYIKADTFVRKNYYGDTLHYYKLRPIVAENAFNGYDTICISDYYIAKFEVTRELYYSIMKKDPSFFKRDPRNPHGSWQTTNNCPVESISWYEACDFIDSLNKLTKQKFRLPTEAEWEYAARGGNPKSAEWKNAFGKVNTKDGKMIYDGSTYLYNDDNLATVGWYYGNSGSKTHEVGLKDKNSLNLYDMAGNVWEWCCDRYADDVATGDAADPCGVASGRLRVCRGGCYCNAYYCASSYRTFGSPDDGRNYVGFRVVRSIR